MAVVAEQQAREEVQQQSLKAAEPLRTPEPQTPSPHPHHAPDAALSLEVDGLQYDIKALKATIAELK